ncbi:hypothetical protein V497_00682, partial [Pseudogymnoascus sp. VKM F-4516 (FW-969)]
MTRNGLETFTINIEVTKYTAIFCRDETATHEFIGPDEFKGYGHEFEKAYTTRQISASTGHHRIITYRFGGLNFIVRHETDGYVDDTKMFSSDDQGPESDSLSSMLGSLSLSPTKGIQTTTPGSKLRIKEEGQMISLESTLELKTRVIHKRIESREVAPQLWISQTPKFVRAYHQRGTFQVPEVEDVAVDIKTWEEDNQRNLRKLAVLISEVIDVVKGCGGNAVVKYDRLGNKLVIWKVNRRKMLPNDLYSIWDDRTNSEAPSNSDAAAVEPVNGIESKPDGKSAVLRPGDTTGKHESATNCKRFSTMEEGPSPRPTLGGTTGTQNRKYTVAKSQYDGLRNWRVPDNRKDANCAVRLGDIQLFLAWFTGSDSGMTRQIYAAAISQTFICRIQLMRTDQCCPTVILKAIGATGSAVAFVQKVVGVEGMMFSGSGEVVDCYGVVTAGGLRDKPQNTREGLEKVKGEMKFVDTFAFNISKHRNFQ